MEQKADSDMVQNKIPTTPPWRLLESPSEPIERPGDADLVWSLVSPAGPDAVAALDRVSRQIARDTRTVASESHHELAAAVREVCAQWALGIGPDLGRGEPSRAFARLIAADKALTEGQ